MGLKREYLDKIESVVTQQFGGLSGVRMLELGDQVIDAELPESTGKEYFVARGVNHISVDLNGLHGSEVRDLTVPREFQDLAGSFEVVTNAGTSEHVEPFAKQYECFKIIHDCLKVGGVAIHFNPDVEAHDRDGEWKGHCNYYYSKSFFEMLASANGYDLIASECINGLRYACVRRTSDEPFMDDKRLFLGHISKRGNEVSRLGSVTTFVKRVLSLQRRDL